MHDAAVDSKYFQQDFKTHQFTGHYRPSVHWEWPCFTLGDFNFWLSLSL